jgi:hypothetical protein
VREERAALRDEGTLNEKLQEATMVLLDEKGEIVKAKIATIRESSRKKMVEELQRVDEREALDMMLVRVAAEVVDPSQRELAHGALSDLTSVEELLFREEFVSSVQALVMDWSQEMDEHTPPGMKIMEYDRFEITYCVLENACSIRNMAAGAHQLEIEVISVVSSDEALAVRLSDLELDGAEGTSGPAQEESHPVLASTDIRGRAFSMEDYRVASAKWDQQMMKNVGRRFYSLAKQDVRAKLSLARGALSMSLTSAHRREVLQQMIDDNLNLGNRKWKRNRKEII